MPEGAIVVDDENSNLSVEIIEKKTNLSSAVGLKCKLLQFHKNYRPAYYGTWRKRSKQISPKNPFKKDMVQLPCYLCGTAIVGASCVYNIVYNLNCC